MMTNNFSGADNVWDERFSTNKNLYSTAPNFQFADYLKLKKPGKILLPGDGEGRNGVFAAKLGWDVTTFDYSKIAIKHTRELAESAGVSIHSICASIDEVQFPEGHFDIIALIFLHLPPEIRKIHFPRLLNFLKNSGEVYLLGFNKRQIDLTTGGPKNEGMLNSKDELKTDFSTLRIEKLEEFRFELNEGPKHQGMAELIEMVGVK